MVFTFVINLLLLVQPLYLLQIYDRVLVSGSTETLLFISLIAAFALLLLGILDAIRAMICGRIAARLKIEFAAAAFVSATRHPRASLGDVQPLRDLSTLYGFVSGKSLLALFDLPFVPFFIGLLYLIHPSLFWLSAYGAMMMVLLAVANQRLSRGAAGIAEEGSSAAMLSAQSFVRSAETLRAMGMLENAVKYWGLKESESLNAQERLNKIHAIYGGLSRALRIGLQIAILGLGAYLVLAGEMTAGMIFAAALIVGRGLQPIDQFINGWRSYIDTRKAMERLALALESIKVGTKAMDLPAPLGKVSIENVLIFPPHMAGTEPLIRRVSAEIEAGEFVAVIGPSGAGKSTLMRAIVGGIDVFSGAIRIDGADIENWDRKTLGQHVGYLSQDIELLPGTIAQNIARFDPGADDEAVVAAAKTAEVHELIQRLPKGYDTMIGPAGHQLSGGQRQRIGLARAFFGFPRLLVLDEPNASLDSEGDAALEKALVAARDAKITVLLVTQRRHVAERADKIMVLRDGILADFGSCREVLAREAGRVHVSQETVPPVISGGFIAVTRAGTSSGSQRK